MTMTEYERMLDARDAYRLALRTAAGQIAAALGALDGADNLLDPRIYDAPLDALPAAPVARGRLASAVLLAKEAARSMAGREATDMTMKAGLT